MTTDPLFWIIVLFGAMAIAAYLFGDDWPDRDGDYEDWEKHFDQEAPNRKRRR